jgi:hypothetical protein
MTLLLSLVAGQWAKYFWPAIALVTAFLYWNYLTSKIDSLQQHNTQLKSEIVTYVENQTKLKQAISDQNESITKMNDQFIILSKAAAELVKGTNKNNDDLTSKLTNQLSAIRSIKNPKDCQSAIDLVVDIAKENKWPTKSGEIK